MDSKRASYFILLAAAFIWCSLLFVPPLLSALDAPASSHLGYRFFSRICHQYDSRSFHFLGYPLAVCVRCSSIYVGFLCGVFIMTLRPGTGGLPRTFWLFLALAPMLFDVILDGIGLHPSNLFSRILTGLTFGVGSAMVLAPLLADALHTVVSKGARAVFSNTLLN